MKLIYFTTYFSLFVGFGISLVGSEKLLKYFEGTFFKKSIEFLLNVIKERAVKLAGSLQTILAIREIALSTHYLSQKPSLEKDLKNLEEVLSNYQTKLTTTYDKISKHSEIKPSLFRLNCFFSATYSLSMIIFAGMSAHIQANTDQSTFICYRLFYITISFFALTFIAFIFDFFRFNELARKIIRCSFLTLLIPIVIRFFKVSINEPHVDETELKLMASIGNNAFVYLPILLYPLFHYILYFLKNQFLIPVFYVNSFVAILWNSKKIAQSTEHTSALWEASYPNQTLVPYQQTVKK